MTELKLPEDHPYVKGRVCTTCGEFKSSEHFYLEKDKRAFGGITMRSKCKPCTELRKYKADIKRRYGISYEEYVKILEAQGGGCAICGSDVNQNSRTSGKLFVDHCHTSGRVRGLLCSKCNHALGLFNDNPSLLEKALTYLNT